MQTEGKIKINTKKQVIRIKYRVFVPVTSGLALTLFVFLSCRPTILPTEPYLDLDLDLDSQLQTRLDT